MTLVGREPRMPAKREHRIEVVDSWLGRADVIELPPDAHADVALREAIERVLDGLPQAEDADDLELGKAVLHPARGRVFKTVAVLQRVAEAFPAATAADVCRHLRSLGHENGTVRFGDRAVRAWWRA